MTHRATVICHASLCHRSKAGGWATWINVNGPAGEHVRIKESGTFKRRPKTSTHAEQLSCMIGIWLAYQNGARDILVQTDCLSLVTERGYIGAQGAREFRMATVDYWPEASVHWRHVKGHTAGEDARSWVNNWCDAHAKRHMRKQRGNNR